MLGFIYSKRTSLMSTRGTQAIKPDRIARLTVIGHKRTSRQYFRTKYTVLNLLRLLYSAV